MATRRKKKEEKIAPIEENIKEEKIASIEKDITTKAEKSEEKEAVVTPEPEKTKKSTKKEKSVEAPGPKYAIGSIVYVKRDADADLNGFKLFPQYKKYTYTVEAYDEISGVYTLRRLNLSLRLREAFIINPDERAHDQINRRQF